MKFFMFRHYSTAQKIFASVKEKIAAAIKNHPRVIKAYEHEDIISFKLSVDGESALVEKLGDVLKEHIPDVLYTKYQQLPEDKKNQLRDEIVNEYFESLNAITKQLESIKLNVTILPVSARGYEIFVLVTFPAEFSNKTQLAGDLRNSISLVHKELVATGKDLLQNNLSI